MSGAVFLSYASQDAEEARRISQTLSAAGVEVWFDQSDLRGGDAWDQKIRRQIRECALFVPVISSNTQARHEGYFRREWRLAVERTHDMADHVTFLLPIAIGALQDAEAHVPEAFRDVQWTRMPQNGALPAGFVETVRGLLHKEPPKEAPSTRPPASAPAADPKSVAVLAFANRSDDKENEYFSDGISEELINALAKVPGLRVSARTSAFHFKGRDTPIAEIARQLGVAYLVEGSVRKVGERVRITAQLIKAADGFHAWSDTFTRDLKDIFAVQDEIAGLIASNLALKLAPSTRAASVDPKAFELLMKARVGLHTAYDDHATAIGLIEASLAIDNGSAMAWALLASPYIVRASLTADGAAKNFEKARQAATRAIELDPNLAAGHGALGVIHYLGDFDWTAAATSLARALVLSPGDAHTLGDLSTLAQIVGRRERALELGRQALELDPISSRIGYIFGKALFQAGLFEDLERHGQRMVTTSPGVVYGHVFTVYSRLFQGRVAEADRAVAAVPDGFFMLVCSAHVDFALGKVAESEAALNAAKAKFAETGAYQIADIHALRGEVDLAFEWLERAFVERDPGLTWLMNDPFMRGIRTDPRWHAFMRKMKLDDDYLRSQPSLWSF